MTVTTEAVEAALEKIKLETVPSTDYMTAAIHAAISGAAMHRTSQAVILMVVDGVEPEVATKVANDLILDAAFHLGLAVGRELESSRSFSEMMLGLGGFDEQQPDAGKPEHGGE